MIDRGLVLTEAEETFNAQTNTRMRIRDKNKGSFLMLKGVQSFMIRLGIIGTDCSFFDERYLPLFEQLRSRVQIVAVYDSVLVHARRIAANFEAQVSCSYQQLVDRSDIHGLLMLSPIWSAGLPVSDAMLRNKPLFCSQAVWNNIDEKQQLEALYRETGATVVVDSECRYWPTILRARELQATLLGQPLELLWQTSLQSLDCSEPHQDTISKILDGIRFLLQRSYISQAQQSRLSGQAKTSSLGLLFDKRPDADNSESIPVTVLLSPPLSPFLLRIRCEQGTIDINSPIDISWQSGEESHQEFLSEEQSGTERQIDHFCRHIAGGLIPLHNLTNALWCDSQSVWLQRLLAKKYD